MWNCWSEGRKSVKRKTDSICSPLSVLDVNAGASSCPSHQTTAENCDGPLWVWAHQPKAWCKGIVCQNKGKFGRSNAHKKNFWILPSIYIFEWSISLTRLVLCHKMWSIDSVVHDQRWLHQCNSSLYFSLSLLALSPPSSLPDHPSPSSSTSLTTVCISDSDHESEPTTPQTPHARPSQRANQDVEETHLDTSQEMQPSDKFTPQTLSSSNPGLFQTQFQYFLLRF